MTDRREAISRLGVPRCPQCGALSVSNATVLARTTSGDLVETGTCSARCAITYLDTMYSGTARIANMKETGVLATKQKGKRVGIWRKGRQRVDIENRRAARDEKR